MVFHQVTRVWAISYKNVVLCLPLSVCRGYAQYTDRGMMPSDHFSLTREIAKVALLYGYVLEAGLHSEMTL